MYIGRIFVVLLPLVSGACSGSDRLPSDSEEQEPLVLRGFSGYVPTGMEHRLLQVSTDLHEEAPACRFAVEGVRSPDGVYVTNTLAINRAQCFDRLMAAMSRRGFLYVSDPVGPYWRLQGQ